MKMRNRSRRGMTLLEVVIAIGITGFVLATLALMTIGTATILYRTRAELQAIKLVEGELERLASLPVTPQSYGLSKVNPLGTGGTLLDDNFNPTNEVNNSCNRLRTILQQDDIVSQYYDTGNVNCQVNVNTVRTNNIPIAVNIHYHVVLPRAGGAGVNLVIDLQRQVPIFMPTW